MKDNKKIKINILTIILFFLLITVTIFLSSYIHKLDQDKDSIIIGATKKINVLNNKINDLENKLQQKDNVENIPETNTHVKAGNIVNQEISKYIIDTKIIDEAGISYEDVSITLYEDNVCNIYEGYGNSLTGVYQIEDKKLIANMVLAIGEEGSLCYSDTNVIFEFEIVNDATIKLKNIKDNNKLEEGQTSKYVKNNLFSIGMTYSTNKSNDSDEKVILAEKAYMNHAWGFSYNGMAIFNDGSIYEWNFYETAYRYYANSQEEHMQWILDNGFCINTTVNEKDLEEIEKNISILENTIEFENVGMDMGSNYITVWNSNKEEITLKQFGDFSGENKSDVSQKLIKIITKYLK